MKRGRPISRGAGALGLLILRPVQYTAALRPAARPANPSTEAYRSFPSGRGSRHCNSSSRKRGGVTLASSNNNAEMTGAGATMQLVLSSKTCNSARRGLACSSGPATSAMSSFAGRSRRLAFAAQGGGLQEQGCQAAARRTVAPRCMSQTSRPVFPPQQAGDMRDGSPAAGGRVAGKEDERHSNGNSGGKGVVGVREQPAAIHRHHQHHHHPGSQNATHDLIEIEQT